MRFPKHVSTARDFPLHMDVSPGIAGLHSALLPAPTGVVYVPAWVYVELPVPIWWPPGSIVGKHQLTSTVFHNNWSIAQKKHDCGPMISHLVDLGMAVVHTLMSSRNAVFEVGEVKMNDKPVACCTFNMDGIPTPMTSCSIIPVPQLGTSLMALNLNNVVCGMHWIDILAGCVRIIVEAIVGLAMALVPMPKGTGGDLLGEVLGPGISSATGDLSDRCVALVHLAGQILSDYHGDAEMPAPPGPIASGVGLPTLVRDGATGDVRGEAPEASSWQRPQPAWSENPAAGIPVLENILEL